MNFRDLDAAMKVHRSYQGRLVPKQYLNNPLILGCTKDNWLITLDGNHRLKDHIENHNDKIKVVIVYISWLEDDDSMEFDYP